MLKQLKRRFVCVLMALVTLTLCAIFGFLYHFTRVNLEKQCVSMMESVAKNPFQQGLPGIWSESVRLPYFVIKVTARGEITAVSGGNYDLTDTVFLDNLIDAAIHSADDLGSMPDYGLRYLKVKTPGALALVFADTTSETATLHSLAKNCLLIGAGCLAVFFGIALLLARWTARPVEKAWAQQRQFVSDASHELKTPLTVILTNAELLQQPPRLDPHSLGAQPRPLILAKGRGVDAEVGPYEGVAFHHLVFVAGGVHPEGELRQTFFIVARAEPTTLLS